MAPLRGLPAPRESVCSAQFRRARRLRDAGRLATPALEPAMTRTVALYEALIQANVPQPAARRVVEALEADMSSSLATKQDVALLDQRITALDGRMVERFANAQRELDLKLDGLETRLLVKLGALITALAGIAAALQRVAG
jgi:hypothetical protein